jgi:hypothetical protein
MHQEVEDRTLGRQDPSRVPPEVQDDRARPDRTPVAPGRDDREALRPRDRSRGRDPRYDTVRLREDASLRGDRTVEQQARRAVVRSTVFSKGVSSEAR